MRLWAHINHVHVLRKKIKLRDPTCDVSCISTNTQDGRQLNISNQNISRNKADVKIPLWTFIYCFGVSQMKQKFLFPFPLKS